MREMKDSGVEWIGEIPSSWKVYKNKYLLEEMYSGGTPIATNDAFYPDQGTPFVSISDMSNDDFVSTTKKFVSDAGIADKKLKVLPVGTILYSIYATIGAISELKIDATISQAIVAFTLKDQCIKQYYKYCLSSMREYISSETNDNTQFNLSAEKVSRFRFPLPLFEEQHRIADYLDTKCAQIDRAIARQQEVIEKLKEYKLSVITEAVTKGLNPDVPMKDSGIEWIGDIPEGWEVSALKNYIDVLPGYAFASLDFDTENGVPLLRGVNVTPSGLRWDDVVYWNKPITDELEAFLLCENDIVFGLDRPWINEGTRITIISKSDLPCLLLQRVCRIRSTEGLDFRIVYYWLSSLMFQEVVSLATTGVSVPHISTRQIGNFSIVVPSITEQCEIVDYLDSKCSSIDSVISQKNGIIGKLTEYKRSLIYEVVTGKREV